MTTENTVVNSITEEIITEEATTMDNITAAESVEETFNNEETFSNEATFNNEEATNSNTKQLAMASAASALLGAGIGYITGVMTEHKRNKASINAITVAIQELSTMFLNMADKEQRGAILNEATSYAQSITGLEDISISININTNMEYQLHTIMNDAVNEIIALNDKKFVIKKKEKIQQWNEVIKQIILLVSVIMAVTITEEETTKETK